MKVPKIKLSKNPIIILIPSIFIFCWLFLLYYHPINAFTQDLGRHLLLGKIIFNQKNIPDTNLFSYTFPNNTFINHHWLSEVFFYLTEKIHLHLLLLILSSIAVLAILIPYIFSYKRVKSVSVFVIGLLAVGIMQERIALRPEILSFLLTGLYVTILYYYRERDTKLIYFLPLLSLLWIQLHIYFFVGLVLLLLFITEQIFFYLFTKNPVKLKTLSIIFIISVCISVLNPNSISGLFYPLTVFNNYGYAIEENQNIFFLESLGINKVSVIYFKILAVLGIILLVINFRKSRLIDWLLYLTFVSAGLIAVRNLPLSSIVLLIPLSRYLDLSYQKLVNSLGIGKSKINTLNIIICITVISFVSYNIYGLIQENKVGYRVNPGSEKALDFVINNNINGPIFNNFDIGSYIIYRLYPKELVFVDGRPEAYPSVFFRSIYIPMQQDPSIFSNLSTKYGFNSIIFSHTDQTPWASKFLGDIWNNSDWIPVYLDETTIVFVKNTELNSSIINQHEIDKSNIKYNINDQTQISYLRLASFFSKIGALNNELLIYEEIISQDPDNCIALRNAAIVSSALNNNLGQLYASRYSASCK